MFQELTPDQFAQVQPLFAGFDYSLSLQAAIEGTNPGRIFVDDVGRPHTGLALTVEGYLLAGDHDDPRILDDLCRFLAEQIFTGQVYVNGAESLSLAVYPHTWEARLPVLIPGYEPLKLPRYHYLCRQVALDWRASLPADYALRRIDAELLADPEGLPDREEIEACWGSLAHFEERGIGFCAMHGGRVVSHCTADCAAGTQVDVGVHTDPAHRRKGLATATAAATVEYCLEHGAHQVGWHCNVENVASWKTAERVGFARNREYVYYYYAYDPVEQWQELGWHSFMAGDYARAAGYYERVLAARPEVSADAYLVAALAWAHLGATYRAVKHLVTAAERGCTHADWARRQPGFRSLHDLPEWERALARMDQAAQGRPPAP